MHDGLSPFRITLFALISAIEEDARRLIITHIAPNYRFIDIVTGDGEKKIVERAGRDSQQIDENDPSTWIPYLDYPDSYQIIRRFASKLPTAVSEIFKKISQAFERSIPIRNAVMHGRPLSASDKAAFFDLVDIIAKQKSDVWRSFNEANERRDDLKFIETINFRPLPETGRIIHNLPSPDFDDTGFVGREAAVAELTKALLGPFPLISLLGEGGLGKTAVALKTAYDLLDRSDCPYEMIVWVSAKVEKLTAKEIVRIEHAITSSLGVIDSAASFLKRTAGDPLDANEAGPIAEEQLIDYLSTFKILLIIDNLETVLDQKMISLARRVPPGSKILFTTRVGTGIDFPITIEPFSQAEARYFFRELVKALRVSSLQRLTDPQTDKFCARLNNSPLFLKWFMLSVKMGSTPERLIEEPKLAVEFCLSNVLSFVSEEDRYVAYAVMFPVSPPTLAEIQYLVNRPPQVISASLKNLIIANIIRMDRTREGETIYVLNALPRTYLTKFQPPPARWANELMLRQRQLASSLVQNSFVGTSSKYSADSFTARSPRDRIIIKGLLDCNRLIRSERFFEAEELLGKLRELAPDYFEVKRVGAFLAFQTRDYVRARTLYEEALSEAPEHAPLRLFYAGFYLRAHEDAPAALVQLRKAAEIDPDSYEVSLEQARCLMFIGEFDQSLQLLDRIKDVVLNTASRRFKQIYFDVRVQLICRKFDRLMQATDWPKAAVELVRLSSEVKAVPLEYLDQKLKGSIDRVGQDLVHLRDLVLQKRVANTRELEEAFEHLSEFVSQFPVKPMHGASRSPDELHSLRLGSLKNFLFDKSYGFIFDPDGSQVFFHKSQLVDQNQLALLKPGVAVRYAMGRNKLGPCAIKVELVY